MSLALDRLLPRALIAIALAALSAGGGAWASGNPAVAHWVWAAGAVPVIVGLVVSIVRDFLAGRLGVDAVALISMIGALALSENLAAIVVAVMYAGGNALEEFAVSRAERDLKSLIDRAPRIAHRETAGQVGDIPVADVAIGDRLLVRAGEVVPVDGILADSDAVLDESALTGEPIPVTRRRARRCAAALSTQDRRFRFRRRQRKAKAPTPASCGWRRQRRPPRRQPSGWRTGSRSCFCPSRSLSQEFAWAFSGDPVRGLAVLVTATPCPLILAAPVAYIAGVARAARRGILMKGGLALEALARTRTVIFDKTGTLTVGGQGILRIETAPGWSIDEMLRVVGSLEQASQHPVAGAIVAAANERGLGLDTPTDVREAMGSGLDGEVSGRRVRAGAHGYVFGSSPANPWARRILRQASFRSALVVFVVVDGRRRARSCLPISCAERRRAPSRVCEPLAFRGSSCLPATARRLRKRSELRSISNSVLSDRDPADKVAAVAVEQELQPTLMVGDGVNDAPALAAANVGVAMGARGASASSEAADVVILVDAVDRVSDAVGIARRTYAIAFQSMAGGMTHGVHGHCGSRRRVRLQPCTA